MQVYAYHMTDICVGMLMQTSRLLTYALQVCYINIRICVCEYAVCFNITPLVCHVSSAIT